MFRPFHRPIIHRPIHGHHRHNQNLAYLLSGRGPAPQHHIMHNGSTILTATIGGSPLPVFFAALGEAALITIANIVQNRRDAGAVAFNNTDQANQAMGNATEEAQKALSEFLRTNSQDDLNRCITLVAGIQIAQDYVTAAS